MKEIATLGREIERGREAPPDVEEQARALILNGIAPPVSWREHIRRLDFEGTDLADAARLS